MFMYRYCRGSHLFTCASMGSRTSWDPTVALSLNHPTLILLEKCRTRAHFKQILAQMIRIHLITQTFPISRLLSFSAISHPENIDMAILLFNHYASQPNLYIYNTMISALSFSSRQSFSLYNSMLRSNIFPDKHTHLYLLKASNCLSEGKQIHCHAIITGFMCYSYLQNSLIKMYLKYGEVGLALQVFQQMPTQDAVSCNIMIVGYARNGYTVEALQLFCKMVGSGLDPDEFTMVGLLMSCGRLGDVRRGKSVHAWIERRRFISAQNSSLGNSLLDMYVKCNELELARRIFDTFVDKDIISWNTIVAGYAKAGELEVACNFFDAMPSRDLITWNSLITGYTKRGNCQAVMDLFKGMLAENVRPDKITIASLICVAAEVGDLDLGRWMHGWVVRTHIKLDAFLASALIDMYCKCGDIERAIMVFKGVIVRDVTVWTAMISGFAFHGYGSKALEFFWEMQEDLMPNWVTLVAVLTACSHSGMVDQGHRIFNSMKEKYGIEPGVEHYGCLVDLLGRAGRLNEAKHVIEKMLIKPSRSVWGSLLSACKAHGNMELAEIALKELLKLEPEKEGGYVLLSNIYAAYKKWNYSDEIREIMESRGVKKTAGCSSLVVDGVVHQFVAADKRHPRWLEIYSLLVCLNSKMKLGADISLNFLQLSLDSLVD